MALGLLVVFDVLGPEILARWVKHRYLEEKDYVRSSEVIEVR